MKSGYAVMALNILIRGAVNQAGETEVISPLILCE